MDIGQVIDEKFTKKNQIFSDKHYDASKASEHDDTDAVTGHKKVSWEWNKGC